MKFLIVTGLSGAGKTTALKELENLGFFCVDNLPCVLLGKLAQICFKEDSQLDKVAVGIDSRSRSFFDELETALEYLNEFGFSAEILFLHCEKDELVNRYNFTRQTHPLMDEGCSVLECIQRETELLEPIRSKSTYLLDTTRMQRQNMKNALIRLYGNEEDTKVRVLISSFGFKRGIPVDADYVFDARFLPNPYNVPELRAHSGKEETVVNYLHQFEDFSKAVELICQQLEFIVPRYMASGKRELFYAIGCTGGFHRSVAIAEATAQRLRDGGFDVACVHRDMDTEGKKWKDHSQQ